MIASELKTSPPENTQPKSTHKGEIFSLLRLLVITISVAIAGGVLWGFFRPAYGLVRQDNSWSIDKETISSSYEGFLTLLALSAVIGLFIGILSFRYRAHSLLMMAYSGVLALFAVYTVTLADSVTVSIMRSGADHDLNSVVPAVSPDLSFFVAITMAITAYWMRSVASL